MKRNIISFSLFFVLSLAFMSISTMAQAINTTTTETIPLSGSIGPACNGEGVDYEGNLRVVTHFTMSNSGQINIKYNGTINVHGVGQITGTEYIAHENWSIGERYDSSDSAPYNATWSQNGRLISRGGMPDFRFHVLIQSAFNANGELTSTRFVITSGCM